MKTSTRDQVEGALKEVKGRVKEAAGRISNSPDLTRKGQAEVQEAKVQKKVGQVKRVFEK